MNILGRWTSEDARELRALRAAYGRLQQAYHDKSEEAEREKERAARAGLMATEPCPMCEEYERERNNALLDLDTLRADLEHEQKARHLMEELGFAGIRADGEST
jgi:hypothetical protein